MHKHKIILSEPKTDNVDEENGFIVDYTCNGKQLCIRYNEEEANTDFNKAINSKSNQVAQSLSTYTEVRNYKHEMTAESN